MSELQLDPARTNPHGSREQWWRAQMTDAESARQTQLDARAAANLGTLSCAQELEGLTAAVLDLFMPGEVIYLNRAIVSPRRLHPSESEWTEFDIETQNAVIQIKSGWCRKNTSRDLRDQLIRSAQVTDKTVVGFAPQLSNESIAVRRRQGYIVFNRFDDMLTFLRGLRAERAPQSEAAA